MGIEARVKSEVDFGTTDHRTAKLSVSAIEHQSCRAVRLVCMITINMWSTHVSTLSNRKLLMAICKLNFGPLLDVFVQGQLQHDSLVEE